MTATAITPSSVATLPSGPLTPDELEKMNAYWRACNYLSAGMIYLRDNPLLRSPLKAEHIKRRLLGHWGSDPGQSFLWVHLNRLIRKLDLNMIYVSGPGHGAPATLSNCYLEGVYSEVYPDKSQDETGLCKFLRQFSFPGGIGSHCTPETPGSIHEGGELGYSLSHAYGAAFDNPDLIVAVAVGDGEAETGPLATSWHSNKFLNPVRDGAVLPVLHLNGYKIANPTILARISPEELDALFRGYGYTPYVVEGNEPFEMHQKMAATLEACVEEIRRIQAGARSSGKASRPRWPMIILRTPKGWTGPKEVDGHKVEDFWRAHQVPISDVPENPAHMKLLEQWLRSYNIEELFDASGKLLPELRATAPDGIRRMSGNPHANGGLLRKPLDIPDFCDYAVKVKKPGAVEAYPTEVLAEFLAEVMRRNMTNFRVFGPDETASNRLQAIYKASKKTWLAAYNPEDADGGELALDGRVMEMLSEHTLEGWLEGYLLTGRHGFFSSYEAFIHVIDSMFNQHAKWLESSKKELTWRAPISSLNLLITSLVWRQDHNGFTHQDPGFLDVVTNKSPSVTRIYLPPDANCLLSVADHCLRSVDYVNVIVADKQQHLQYLDMEAAIDHCTKGIGIWDWASTDEGAEPDAVMACAGDIATQECLAAVEILRERFPDLKIRFVNVVDLYRLEPESEHPHGLSDRDFDSIFTVDKPVIFNFHAYASLIHKLTYRRANHANMHVRGYKEKGNINTPLELAILNQVDRFDLAIDVIDRVPRLQVVGAHVKDWLKNQIVEHVNYAHENGIDPAGDSQLEVECLMPDSLVLAVNSGSSSLKFGLFAERNGDEAVVLRGGADGVGQPNGKLRVEDSAGKVLLDESYTLNTQANALEESVRALLKFSGAAPVAVGHRVVHGGPHLRQHQRITDDLIRKLEAAVHFAPLHIPAAVELIKETERLLPKAQQFACFDTAFHATMPESSSMYALPEPIRDKGVQRYGFHGLSYESIVHRLGKEFPARVVCAHLGSGASLVALRDGKSVDTSMGLTPTGGIPMATRVGDLDPGVVIFLLRAGMNANELEMMLNRKSGLGAIAGETDMRQLLARMGKGDKAAALAVEIFVGAARKFIGAYAAELGGLDLLVFTGGIGEHSEEVRGRICKGLDFLGIEPNGSGGFSKVAVMTSEEEAQIARHCRRLMRS